MPWAKTREEAIKLRRELKAKGRCACFCHTHEGSYYVQDCPKRLIYCTPLPKSKENEEDLEEQQHRIVFGGEC